MIIWSNSYIMNTPSITIGVYDFLEWVVGFNALEEAKGLDPMGMASNIGPLGNTSSSYFKSLGIKVSCLFSSCWCMSSTPLGCSTHTLGCIIHVTTMSSTSLSSSIRSLAWSSILMAPHSWTCACATTTSSLLSNSVGGDTIQL